MKVYCIVTTENYHGNGESVSVTKVCHSKESASKAFAEQVENLKMEYADWIEDEDSFVICEDETSFEVYEDGYSSNNHISCSIEESFLVD